MDLYYLQEIVKKQILDKVLDASKKVVHKETEFIGNKIGDVVSKSKYDNIEKQSVEKIIIPPVKREEILNKLRRVLQKWNTIKYLNY